MSTVTLLDGGMGRELARVGAPFRQPEWSALAMMESPAHVTAVHESYAAAGADVLTTNAYALVPFHIGPERFASEGRRLAALAGQLARAVADAHPGVRVAGCLPPVLGSYRPDLFDPALARPILEVLVDEQVPYVDVWLAETTSSIAEVRLVREVLDESGRGRGLPLWVSFTVEDARVASPASSAAVSRLRSGEPVDDAVRAAMALGAEVVSFNCSQPEAMEPALIAARSAAPDVPLGVYANAFVLADGEGANASLHDIRDDVTPPAYCDWADRWVAAGATLVGGCCGVGAEHLSALATHLSAS